MADLDDDDDDIDDDANGPQPSPPTSPAASAPGSPESPGPRATSPSAASSPQRSVAGSRPSSAGARTSRRRSSAVRLEAIATLVPTNATGGAALSGSPGGYGHLIWQPALSRTITPDDVRAARPSTPAVHPPCLCSVGSAHPLTVPLNAAREQIRDSASALGISLPRRPIDSKGAPAGPVSREEVRTSPHISCHACPHISHSASPSLTLCRLRWPSRRQRESTTFFPLRSSCSAHQCRGSSGKCLLTGHGASWRVRLARSSRSIP